MIYLSKNNQNSKFTAKERKAPSLPTRILLARNLFQGEILDFGCGFGIDVEFLKSKDFNVYSYDPYYFPKFPQRKFDKIICL